ncbi:interleukin-1 receptor type 2 isoform X2 [Tamandua tetradactyla]
MFLLSMLAMGVSVCTMEPRHSTAAEGNCQFYGKYFQISYKVEGEPVVLRCPQMEHWLRTSASPHFNVMWHKNGSGVTLPGEEDTRVLVQRGALWILPALQGDSGTYVCTTRNASYCEQMSVELSVVEKSEASLPLISYSQILTLSTSGPLVCPELSDFTRNRTDLNVQWYKDSVLLGQDDKKFLSVKGSPRLLISNVSAEDAGYYSCGMTFVHRGRQYNVTRSVKLRVHKKEAETIPVIVFPHQTILASLGSRLTVPCKVFLGAGTQATTLLWWTANNSHIESAYQEGRVTEGQRQEYSENNENYVEVPLIFDPVTKEDMNTDFQCEVVNTLGFQTLRTTVKEASTFSWEIALAPLLLVFLALGGIWMHERWKHRTGKAYSLTTLKMAREGV